MACVFKGIPLVNRDMRESRPDRVSPDAPYTDNALTERPSGVASPMGVRNGRGASEPTTSSPSCQTWLTLHNRQPRWSDRLQCWRLDFHGRVTCASVKNFQLVSRDVEWGAGSTDMYSAENDAMAPADSLEQNHSKSCMRHRRQTTLQAERDACILQFGKVGNDVFCMDYKAPMTAFHAFAIALTSFNNKFSI